MSAANIKKIQNSPPFGGVGSKKYTGVIIPAVTPLTEKLQIDEAAVSRLFALFYQHKMSPFILGTTGESPSLSLQLKKTM
jgi:4-hydroxy-tetrahydrodipicolinate synthase